MTILAVSKEVSKPTEKNFPQSYSPIPHNHLDWALKQPPTVLRLFIECWRSDAFGNTHDNKYQFKLLKTSLKADNLRKAKKALKDVGLFLFEKATHYINGYSVNVDTVFNNQFSSPRIVDCGENPQIENLSHQDETLQKQPLEAVKKILNVVTQIVSPGSHKQTDNPDQEDLQSALPRLRIATNQTDNPGKSPGSQSTEGLQKSQLSIQLSAQLTTKVVEQMINDQEEAPMNAASSLSKKLEVSVIPFGTLSAAPTQTIVVQTDPLEVAIAAVIEQPNAPDKPILTKTEIFNYLDQANLGICPPENAVASMLDSEYFQPMALAIVHHPEWGFKVLAGQLALITQESSPPRQKRSWREKLIKRLKAFFTLKECPDQKLIQECFSDPILSIKIKQMFGIANFVTS